MPQQLDLDLGAEVNALRVSTAPPTSSADVTPRPTCPLDAAVAHYRHGLLSAQALRLHQVLSFSHALLPTHDHSRGLSYTAVGMFMEQRPSRVATDPAVRGAGKRNVVVRASKELEDLGLVSRRRSANAQGRTDGPGTPYLWQLHRDDEAAQARWPDASEAICEHIRRHQRDLSLSDGAILTVLAYLADAEGCLRLDAAALRESGFGYSKKRVLQALTTLQERGAGIHKHTIEYVPGERAATHHLTLTVPGLGLSTPPDLAALEADSPEQTISPAKPKRKPRKPRVTKAEAIELWEAVEHQPLVGEALTALRGTLVEGKELSPTRAVNSVLRPVIELQGRYPSPCVEYALQETLKRLQRDHRFGAGFAKYMARVAENNKHRFDRTIDPSAPTPGTNAAAAHALTPEGLAQLAEQRLTEAAELNREGRSEEARARLERLLGGTAQLAVLFNDDEAETKRHLVEAFRRGIEDFRNAFDYTISADYLPDGEMV